MTRRAEGAGLVGVGVAACAACCAAPIIGVLSAIGVGTLLAIGVFGIVGMVVAALAIVPIARRRRTEAAPVRVTIGERPDA